MNALGTVKVSNSHATDTHFWSHPESFFPPTDPFISQVIFTRACCLLKGVANQKTSFCLTRWVQIICCDGFFFFFFPNEDFFFIRNEQHNICDAVLIW